MALYTVHLTFRAPGLHRHFEWHRALLGRQSIVIHGAEGMIAATVTVNSPDGAAFAGLKATEMVTRAWQDHGIGGPLNRISWQAERERAMAGLLRRRLGMAHRPAIQYLWDVGNAWPGAGGWTGDDGWPGDDEPGDGGMAGVREPRRPKPAPPSLTMSLPLPGEVPGLH